MVTKARLRSSEILQGRSGKEAITRNEEPRPRSAPSSTAEIEALAEQVCEAVGELASQQIVGRDAQGGNLHRGAVVEGHLLEAE